MTNLFDHGRELDVYVVSGFLVLMIVVTIGLETALHIIDKRLKPHAHYYRMVAQLYQELMILGLISFLMIVIRAIFPLSEEIDIQFEFVHVWVFLMAAFYIVNALTTMLRSRAAKRHWDATANMRLDDLLRRFDAQNLGGPPRHWLRRWLFGREIVIEEMEYHVMKDQFLRTEDLPVDFDFAKYLRSCMSLRVTRQLHIPNSTWLCGISFLTLNVVRAGIAQVVTDEEPTSWGGESSWLYFTLGLVLFTVSTGLLMVGRRAKDLMMARTGCSTLNELYQQIEHIRTHPIQKSFASGVAVRRATHVGIFSRLFGAFSYRPNAKPKEAAAPAAADGKQMMPTSRGNAHGTLQIRGERARFVVDSVFPFNSPWLYTKALEVLTLFQCFYLALGVLVTISTAAHEFEAAGAFFFILSCFVPQGVVMFSTAPAIMKNLIFIESVGNADRDVVAQVLTGMQATHALKIDLSHKMHEIIEERGGGEEGLAAVWAELDPNSIGFVLRSQFRDVLAESFDLDLTDKQLHRLFRAVDSQQTGQLTERDFRSLVFLNESLPFEQRAGAGVAPKPDRQKPVSAPVAVLREAKAADAKHGNSAESKAAVAAAASGGAGAPNAKYLFARCFGGLQVDCLRCGASVQVNKIVEHAESCTAAKAPIDVALRNPRKQWRGGPPRGTLSAAQRAHPVAVGVMVPSTPSPVGHSMVPAAPSGASGASGVAKGSGAGAGAGDAGAGDAAAAAVGVSVSVQIDTETEPQTEPIAADAPSHASPIHVPATTSSSFSPSHNHSNSNAIPNSTTHRPTSPAAPAAAATAAPTTAVIPTFAAALTTASPAASPRASQGRSSSRGGSGNGGGAASPRAVALTAAAPRASQALLSPRSAAAPSHQQQPTEAASPRRARVSVLEML